MDMGDTCESGSNVESLVVQDGLERKTDQQEGSRPREKRKVASRDCGHDEVEEQV